MTDHWEKIKNRIKANRPAVILCLVLLVGLLLAGTVAYLQSTAKLSNTFTIGEVQTEVTEKFDGNVKSEVAVKNNGNTDAYIRTKILIYFVDRDGNITGEKPVAGRDYTITMGDLSKWVSASEGYYYKAPVPAMEKTDPLINECKVVETADVYKDGNRRLVVDIAAEAIQAHHEAVSEAWGNDVTVENGMLTEKMQTP